MKSINRQNILRGQKGQAATEFIVASVFLLVPLFLIVPLLGKYIDIRHAAIQQARFEVWEYTVWSGENERIMAGIKSDESAGRKGYIAPIKGNASLLDTRHQGMGYFFSDPTDKNYGAPGNQFQSNPLWTDHRGNTLFESNPQIINQNKKINEDTTPIGTNISFLKKMLRFLDDAIDFVGTIFEWISSDSKFDAFYMEGYYTTDIDVQVKSIDEVLPRETLSDVEEIKSDPLVISATASVLTNGWNAGGRDNATSESRGLVVTALLRPISKTFNMLIAPINEFFGWFEKIPIVHIKMPQLPGVPDFGYVKDDLIPYEHLDFASENKQSELKDKNVLFYYKVEKADKE